MISKVLQWVDVVQLPHVALVVFCLMFLLIVWATYRLSPKAIDRFGSIPLSDSVEDPRNE